MTLSCGGGGIRAGSDDVVCGVGDIDAGICDGVDCGVDGAARAGSCDEVACVVLAVLAPWAAPEVLAPWVVAAVLVRCLIPATILLYVRPLVSMRTRLSSHFCRFVRFELMHA